MTYLCEARRGIVRAIYKVGHQHQKKVLPFRFYWGEVIMVWRLVRVALFTGSFLIGLTFFGPGRSPVVTKPATQPVKIIRPLPKLPGSLPDSGHSGNHPRII